ncbi:MAG: hypothetical protein JW850_05480 [Thermoflexales bacterium]|nr:hypothetical protein [Thermoflexales bacterium]
MRDTAIGEESGPGTILRDFETFLTFFKRHPPSFEHTRRLPGAVLRELNACLSHPIQMTLIKPLQESYPHVNGLFMLLRSSGLTDVVTTCKGFQVIVDDKMYQAWQDSNPTERYCTLLETWLLQDYPDIDDIGNYETHYGTPGAFEDWIHFSFKIPDRGLHIARGKESIRILHQYPGWHTLGLLELFGLVSIQHGIPGEREGWCVEVIWRTLFGDALLALLHNGFFRDENNILQIKRQRMAASGALQHVLQPYFPQWENILLIPEMAFREGVHVFQVRMGEAWRRVTLRDDYSMADLAQVILDAFGVAGDHRYKFQYWDRFGVRRGITHPQWVIAECPADETLVGSVPLKVGQVMECVFDFHWQEFQVILERVDPFEMVNGGPTVLDGFGELPGEPSVG